MIFCLTNDEGPMVSFRDTSKETISVMVPTLISDPKQLMMTLNCLKAAREMTKLPFELVIVETISQYLRDHADVYVWEKNKTTSSRSIGRGFKNCSGSKVVLLTNDVIVDEGWLEHLLECFVIPNCGLSTLASHQFNHKKKNEISEGIWFSVAMMEKEDAWFDENYLSGSWDDTDLIARVYLEKKKVMYRNYKSVVHHEIGMTFYEKPDHESNFDKNEAYFFEKWKAYENTRIMQVFKRGIIL